MGIFDFLKNKTASTTSTRNSILGLSNKEIETLGVTAQKEWEQSNQKEIFRKEAMRRSEDFANIHQNNIDRIDLSKIRYNEISDIIFSPYEVIFLDYINGVSINNPIIAGYWTHDYQVDFHSAIEKFFIGGYLKESDYKFNITKCKTAELKDFLKDRGLKTNGKKDDLIARIITECPESEAINYFNHSCYQHTDKAAEILSQNDYLMFFHQHRNYLEISISEAFHIKTANPRLDKYRIGLQILNSRLKKHKRKKNWGLYRNDIFGMSIISRDQKDYLKELASLFEICYWDLSGYGNNGIIDSNLSSLAPGIVCRIKTLIENLNLNETDLRDMYIESVSKIEISHRLSFVDTYNILKENLAM